MNTQKLIQHNEHRKNLKAELKRCSENDYDKLRKELKRTKKKIFKIIGEL